MLDFIIIIILLSSLVYIVFFLVMYQYYSKQIVALQESVDELRRNLNENCECLREDFSSILGGEGSCLDENVYLEEIDELKREIVLLNEKCVSLERENEELLKR